MPMKVAADDAAGAPPITLPNLPLPPASAAPPPSMPPAMPAMPMLPPAAAPMVPAPKPPITHDQIQTRTQDDGTIVGFIPNPDGSEHIVGVHPPFKLPKGQKPGAGAPMPDLSRAAIPQ
jgi:hypothetical protein